MALAQLPARFSLLEALAVFLLTIRFLAITAPLLGLSGQFGLVPHCILAVSTGAL